jgi:PAS domain S-box-containing protein
VSASIRTFSAILEERSRELVENVLNGTPTLPVEEYTSAFSLLCSFLPVLSSAFEQRLCSSRQHFGSARLPLDQTLNGAVDNYFRSAPFDLGSGLRLVVLVRAFRDQAIDFLIAQELEPAELQRRIKACHELCDTAFTRVLLQQRIAFEEADSVSRKCTEEQLWESEARHRALLQAIPELIFLTSQDGVFLDCHVGKGHGLLVPREDFLGRNQSEILPPELANLFSIAQKKLRETGQVQLIEYALVLDGEQHMFEARIASCEPDRCLTLVRDVTQIRRDERARKLIEDQMQHAQKLESLGILAGGIAHDFNNLLVGILGNADLTLAELDEDSPLREGVEDIRTSASRAAELTRQMLAYSGKGRFVVEAIQVNDVVKEMARLLSASISKKAELYMSLSSSIPTVDADSSQVRQIIMNLITNASDAIGDNPGSIRVTTGLHSPESEVSNGGFWIASLAPVHYVFFEVADSGCGMSAETVKRMFEPFFSTKFTGRGLGLAAVLGIVQAHCGTIHVDSSPGEGTRVRVYLPCPAGVSNALSASIPPPRRLSSRPAFVYEGLVLLVDDEEHVRKLAIRMLERLGFNVIVGTDGEQAVALFRANAKALSLILLDLSMPRLDGTEALRIIRDERPELPVILTSGYQSEELVAIGESCGNGFLQKPFSFESLCDVVAKAMQCNKPIGQAEVS